jgi:integrase
MAVVGSQKTLQDFLMSNDDASGRNARERDGSFSGSFTDRWVRKTPAMAKEVQYAERLFKGRSLMLYVSPPPSGTKTWRVLYYNRRGQPRSKRLGTYPTLSVADARAQAREFEVQIAEASAKAGNLKKIAEDWYSDHVIAHDLASKREIRRQLDRYILPELGDRAIFEIDGEELTDLLRKIEYGKISFKKKRGESQRGRKNPDRSIQGRCQADAVRATLMSMFNWYSELNQKFNPIKPPKRDKRRPQDRQRHRALDFETIRGEGGRITHEWTDRGELRAIWGACNELSIFGALIKMLLLTAQRCGDVVRMKWSDVSPDWEWTIARRAGRNPKGTAGKIKLPALAIEILEQLPRIDGNEHVFPAARSRTKRFNSFSQRKYELDELVGAVVQPWRLHDLRRTARSLMAKAGVSREISERVLGHSPGGVEAVYDVYDYGQQKNDALQKLADEIGYILDPASRPSNVVPIEKAKRRR